MNLQGFGLETNRTYISDVVQILYAEVTNASKLAEATRDVPETAAHRKAVEALERAVARYADCCIIGIIPTDLKPRVKAAGSTH